MSGKGGAVMANASTVVTIPNSETLSNRLLKLSGDWEMKGESFKALLKLLLQYAGQPKELMDLLMILKRAVFDYARAMPVARQCQVHDVLVPHLIDAFILDPELAGQAKQIMEIEMEP
jgi:ABC-type phosphate transport system auxiliary subunit